MFLASSNVDSILVSNGVFHKLSPVPANFPADSNVYAIVVTFVTSHPPKSMFMSIA